MKAAVADPCVRSSVHAIRADSRCMAGKTSPTKTPDFDSTEMRECFLQLAKMVPATRNKEDSKLDKTELLQSVIDYIMDLEDMMMWPADKQQCGKRQPLAERSDSDNIQYTITEGEMPILPASAITSLDSSDDLDFRPPSK